MSIHLESLEESACVGCGASSRETILVPLRSSVGTMLACSRCLSKYGDETLSREADATIAKAIASGPKKSLDNVSCRHCGEPMVRINPRHPFWCERCEAMRRNIELASVLAGG